MTRIILNDDIIKKLLPNRSPFSSKRDFGYVGILGGSGSYCGAPSLSAMALSSLRVGVGVSRLIVEENIAALVQGFAPEITMFKVSSFDDEKSLLGALYGLKALAVGMGWGRESSRDTALKILLENFSGTLLIDADGIFVLKRIGLEYLKRSNAKIILTPHLGEFSTLLGASLSADCDLEKIAFEFAKEYRVILLLKGNKTIVTDGTDIYISNTGCVGMATAGSGDVLSGVIIGFAGYLQSLEATYVGTYIAGRAGELASKKYGEYGMISSDTIKELAFAIKELKK